MNKSEKIILVTGATGQQGGATARHLLAQGWQVRAFVRDPNKPAAQALAQKGVEIVQGDNEDRTALEAAMAGVYGVFSVQGFFEAGTAGEMRQGKNVADAAQAAGIKHLVYSSVGSTERNTGVPHFDSKWAIEQHIRSLALPATILRPVEFMENFYWNRPHILNGTLMSQGLRPHRVKQFVAVDDIGAFAAIVFGNPQAYIGQALEIAGDGLTEAQLAETFGRVIGRPVQLVRPSLEEIASGLESSIRDDLLKMWQWFDEEGYHVNIDAVRQIYPPLKTVESWLQETGWQNAQPPAA